MQSNSWKPPPGSESCEEPGNYVDHFCQRHGLRRTPTLEAESKAIHWTTAANILVNRGYSGLRDDDFTKTPAVGFILQFLHRNFEHTDAAIVAFATGSAASSEGIARMAFESSINIRYILAGQPESRLSAYFDRYRIAEEDRLRNWDKATQQLSEFAKQEQTEGIALRRIGIQALSRLVCKLETEFHRAGIALVPENWPSIFERFDRLGAAITHRTVYARMSSQVHSDAEETIRYIIGTASNDPELMKRMAVEKCVNWSMFNLRT